MLVSEKQKYISDAFAERANLLHIIGLENSLCEIQEAVMLSAGVEHLSVSYKSTCLKNVNQICKIKRG